MAIPKKLKIGLGVFVGLSLLGAVVGEPEGSRSIEGSWTIDKERETMAVFEVDSVTQLVAVVTDSNTVINALIVRDNSCMGNDAKGTNQVLTVNGKYLKGVGKCQGFVKRLYRMENYKGNDVYNALLKAQMKKPDGKVCIESNGEDEPNKSCYSVGGTLGSYNTLIGSIKNNLAAKEAKEKAAL